MSSVGVGEQAQDIDEGESHARVPSVGSLYNRNNNISCHDNASQSIDNHAYTFVKF